MKNTFTFIAVSIFSLSTIFAQNFGVSLENTIWNGDMIRYIYPEKTKNTYGNNSVILGLNYNYNLSENLDVVASAGYAFGFEITPLTANLNYKISDNISANIGMGIYMISDSIYSHNSLGQLVEGTEERKEASTNEFGINFGMSYKLTSNIALTGNYNMLKNGYSDFNGISFGLSYTFGNQTKHKGNKEEIKQAFVEQPINTNNINIIEENKELLKELKQAKSEISTKNTEINRLSSTLDSKNNELETAKLELKNYSERSIELEMKQYLGVKLPVINTNSFSSAFRIAADKYGSSRDQKFWWNKNVYTTERK
jgi:hypothetical protein